MTTLDTLTTLDRALVAHGWPALSPWWRETFDRFVGAGCRQLVVRAGRRAGKSSSLSRYAVAHALAYDVRLIPPGDVGVVAFVSTTRDEAGQRLRTIRAMLDALGIPHRPIEHGVELVGRPIAFKVFVATIAGVSGFTSILVVADEVAKWRDSDSGANPATEVLASVRPAMATQPAARIVLSSSPLGTEDAHATAFDRGDTDHQITAYAPSWGANPTITEEQTRRDEPDLRIWAREYAAEPQAAKLAAFDADAVARAFAAEAPTGESWRAFGVIDASSGKKDRWTWAIARWRAAKDDRAARRLVFERVGSFEAGYWAQEHGEEIVRRVSREMRACGVGHVFADQRESLMLSAMFTRHGLAFHEHPWTGPKKERAVALVRAWLRDGTLVLPAHDGLRRELLAFEERIASSGALTFAGGRGTSGHDDFVSLLLTTAIAETETKSKAPEGSPHRAHRMVEALM